MLHVSDLRKLCTDETISLTQHLLLRMRERGIKYNDIVHTIINGEIIEQYPTDHPYPSCLVLGTIRIDKPLHVVCGVGSGRLWVITTYYPQLEEWESDYKTRKRR